MNLKVFGSFCILAFVLLATVSATNNTTTAAPNTTSGSTPSTPAPRATTLKPKPKPTAAPGTTRIESEMRITSVNYTDVQDLTKGAGLTFKNNFERDMLAAMQNKNKLVKKCVVTKVRSGSVIVDYYLVAETTKDDEVKSIATASTEVSKSGMVGSFITDKSFNPSPSIVTPAPPKDGASSITAMVGIVVSCLGLYYLF